MLLFRQENRAAIRSWLKARGYRELEQGEAKDFSTFFLGTFSLRFNVAITMDGGKRINIPIDAVIMG